jgi:D-aminoacyl-tRNA deacylase
MIAVIQRVSEASVKVNSNSVAEINNGLLILLGIAQDDSIEDVQWLTNKILNLRIFDDESGVMNKSCIELSYDVLTISQFTLYARTKKGNRPSYIDAARPDIAIPLYKNFIHEIDKILNKKTKSGIFGADMKVSLCNDGPVTIIIDTKNKN